MVLNISTEVLQKTTINIGRNAEISKILTAAVINKGFRDLLLENPLTAINQGFGGQNFFLTENEKEILGSIKTTSLSDFSKLLAGCLN